MKRNKVVIQALIIVISFRTCHQLEIASEDEPPLQNILNITEYDQTIFVDIDNDTSVSFKDSILKGIHWDHSVFLVRGINALKAVPDEVLMINRHHNIVFITKFINPNILDIPMLEFILKSYWSILFIIVSTEDSLYNCDHGEFSKEALRNIEEFMNYLWQKYRIMHVLLNLPYVCPNKYVVYNDTKKTLGELYNRTIKLINTEEQFAETISKKAGWVLTRDYPLRGNIFYRFPTAIQDCSGTDIYIKTDEKHSGGFCGMDGLIMSDIMTHFGFNLSLPPLARGYNKYGYQQEDGVVTGILGHIVRRNVDISFNSRFMAKYTTGLQDYKYLYHVNHDALCAILKQPGEEPLWQYPVNAYSWQQWLSIFISFASIGMLMWLFARIRYKIHKTKVYTLLCYILNSLNAGLFGFFLKRRKDLLLLRAACLYASIMVLATYQSYINYVFTTRLRYDILNTLSDLVESGTVIQTSPSMYSLINESTDDLSAAILSRTIVIENANSFEYVLSHPHSATLERQTDAVMVTLMEHTDQDGRPLLYVVNECLGHFYLSYIASTEFPFHRQLHIFMMQIIETGLPEMYYIWTSRALGLEVALPSLSSEPRPARKITMAAQVIPFGVLLVGYVLSVIAFVGEIWWAKRLRVYPYIPASAYALTP